MKPSDGPSTKGKQEQGLYEFKTVIEKDGEEVEVLEKIDTNVEGLIDEESGKQTIVAGGEGENENFIEDVIEDDQGVENDMVALNSDTPPDSNGFLENLLGSNEQEQEEKEEV